MTYTIQQPNGTISPISTATYSSPNSNTGVVYAINPSNTINTITTINTGSVGPNVFSVKGDAEFDGDISFKGKSLNETLTKIEERLAILHPNPKLEEKWEKLKELSKQYRELEAEIIEKEMIWNILKK
jgi:hypothetical protein